MRCITWQPGEMGHTPISLETNCSQTLAAELSSSSWLTSSSNTDVRTQTMTSSRSSIWPSAWSRVSRSVAVIRVDDFKEGRENWYAGQKRDKLLSPIRSRETISGTKPYKRTKRKSPAETNELPEKENKLDKKKAKNSSELLRHKNTQPRAKSCVVRGIEKNVEKRNT